MMTEFNFISISRRIQSIFLGLIVISALASCGKEALEVKGRVQIELPSAGAIGQVVTVGTPVNLKADAVINRVVTNSTATPNLNWSLTTVPTGSRATLTGTSTSSPTFVPDTEGTYIASVIVTAGTLRTRPVLVTVTAVGSGTAATFDHSTTTKACVECHDGTTATGQTANHIATTNSCASCHGTIAWKPVATVDHSQVVGKCSSCHDGLVAKGKPVGHVTTTSECNTCHLTSTWMINPSSGSNDVGPTAGGTSTSTTHPNVTSGCSTCHSGTKPNSHIESTEICEACHNYQAWIPVVTVDHGEVLGSCGKCHGQPPEHPRTSAECNTCHTPADWDIVREGERGAISHRDEDEDDDGDDEEDDEHYRAPPSGRTGGAGKRGGCLAAGTCSGGTMSGGMGGTTTMPPGGSMSGGGSGGTTTGGTTGGGTTGGTGTTPITTTRTITFNGVTYKVKSTHPNVTSGCAGGCHNPIPASLP